ncbi:TPA: hypothetical protein ACXEQR_000117 [Klebsiella pneumoniae]
MTDITELAQMKGQKVEAPYYLAECTECGKMYPSSQLIESRNYMDGDADCYCPHCNAEDADIADLGSGEQPAVMAWNYQQARIDVLVEALEKSEKTSEARREAIDRTHNMFVRERDRASAAEEALEKAQAQSSKWLEAYHKAVSIGARYEERIAELEARTVNISVPDARNEDYDWDGQTPSEAFNTCRTICTLMFRQSLRVAGIKVEAE